MHWFRTYHRFHRESLWMNSADHDLCLLFSPGSLDNFSSSPSSRGMTVVQTDDTFMISNASFLKPDGKESKRFLIKLIFVAQQNMVFQLNGSQIIVMASPVLLGAASHVNRLSTVSKSPVLAEKYVAQRARGGSIASICRTDCLFFFLQASQFPNPSTNNA